MVPFLNALNSLSPLAVIALLASVLFMQQRNKRAINMVSDNHLSGLPDMAASLDRIEGQLRSMNDNIVYIRARVNGGGHGR